ncbi:hypothetical protein DFH09DRAFT_1340090 [Mycena vulgaris]|nr:hypothetical protein DFH09DRAFT_1340090 [Mycena vulgaris]
MAQFYPRKLPLEREGDHGFHATLIVLFSIPSLRCVALVGAVGCRRPSSGFRHVLCSCTQVALTHVYVHPEDGVFPCADDPARIASPPSAALEDLALEYPSDKFPTLHALLLGDGLATPLANLQRLELTLLVGESLEGLETIALNYADSLEHLVINFGSRSHIYVALELTLTILSHHRTPRRPNPPALPPHLRVLTLTASVRKLRMPRSLLTVLASLLTCMPTLEELENLWMPSSRTTPTAPPVEVDATLKRLPRFRAVNFKVHCFRVVKFEPNMRKKLPLANEGELLTFWITSNWREMMYHPMRYFSRHLRAENRS